MKLFYRLFGYLLLGIIVLIGIDEYLSFQTEVEQYENDMIANAIQDGRSLSGMISHVWKESGEKKAIELIRDASESGGISIRWVWVDVLLDEYTLDDGKKEKLEKTKDGEIVSLKMRNQNGDLLRYTYVPVDISQPERGALELKQPLFSLREYSSRMLSRAIIITGMLAFISGLILYVFMDKKIRIPLNRLMEHAQRIGEGDLSTGLKIDGKDELAEMARTMNDMCSRLIIAKEKIKFEYDARLKTLEQLRHTERLSTFGLISADIAHEIGTPINVVDGRAKMILNDNLSSQEIAECAAIIKNQCERMTVIVRQLLDFTRRPKQHFSSENIIFQIKQVFQLLHPMASKQKVTFDLEIAEDVVSQVYADGAQIQQVLINLIMNSVQAMPEGGEVSVKVTNKLLPTDHKDSEIVEKWLKIRISDEGEGICQENLEHIFTPFFTTKSIGTGTGLGLSIAHGIVEEHGGWIDVESNIQKGSIFSIFIPFKEYTS